MLLALTVKQYQVKLYTGDKPGAGCDSNIFLAIFGDRGDTGEKEVDKSNNFNKFERNQVGYPNLIEADLSTFTNTVLVFWYWYW